MKIILIIGLIILILGFCFVMWALCKAASIAEKIEEDIYRNYFGNESKEDKDL